MFFVNCYFVMFLYLFSCLCLKGCKWSHAKILLAVFCTKAF